MKKPNDYIEADPNYWSDIFGLTPIFIFPARIVGGHELMAIEIIKSLTLLGNDVRCYVEPTNSLLIDILKSIIDQSKIKKLPIKQRKLEVFHAFFNFKMKEKVKEFIIQLDEVRGSSVTIVQGDIEIGSPYCLAAGRGVKGFMSYLPFVHTPMIMGKKLSLLRWLLAKIVYKKISRFILISTVFRADLQLLSPKAEVQIVRNRVRDLNIYREQRDSFIQNNTSGPNVRIKIGIIGRISYRHKGHDILLSSLSKLDKKILCKIELIVIGDGEDGIKFEQQSAQLILKGLTVNMVGWANEPWSVGYNLDLLVIPSRFEGVPLVMLEAIELGIPIIATNVDGMKEYLDHNSLFTSEDELSYYINKFVIDKTNSSDGSKI